MLPDGVAKQVDVIILVAVLIHKGLPNHLGLSHREGSGLRIAGFIPRIDIIKVAQVEIILLVTIFLDDNSASHHVAKSLSVLVEQDAQESDSRHNQAFD